MLQAIAMSTVRMLPAAVVMRPAATVPFAFGGKKSPMEVTGEPVGDNGVIIEAGETITRTEESSSQVSDSLHLS
jgi:hypothetical protein